MTNEIKEILEALRDSIDDTGTDKVNFINWVNKIEDCITNLQEENERLKNLYTNEKNHKIDYNYFKVLYSKADKGIIEDLVYKCEQCRILYDSAEKKSIENMNLQQRIDKAIEVIDLITPELWNISNKMTYKLKDVKNILRGDE